MKYVLLQIAINDFRFITSFEKLTDNQFENFKNLGEETILNRTCWNSFDIFTDENEKGVLSYYICDLDEISTLLSDLRDLRINKNYDNEMNEYYNEYVGNNESDEIVLK